jgi:hypothetical protein
MVESFYKNSVCSDMIVLSAAGSITGLINSVSYAGYDYISVTNDDFIYHTPAWDKMLIDKIESKKGYGIAFGKDGTKNVNLPVTSVVSSSIVSSLGWIQHPGLNHLFGDTTFQ